MKNQNLSQILFFFVLFLHACATHQKIPKILKADGGNCDIWLGSYGLDHASIQIMPFENKSKVIFRDSLGQLDTFGIDFPKIRWSTRTFPTYSGVSLKDTVMYCYWKQYFDCNLTSAKSQLRFNLYVASNPRCKLDYCPCVDEVSKKNVDNLYVFYENMDVKPSVKLELFYRAFGTLTKKDFKIQNEIYPEIEIFNRKFKNVETQDFSKAPYGGFEHLKARFYYNTTEGIVAYIDSRGKKWRLEKMY
jgi:hypothetical protein